MAISGVQSSMYTQKPSGLKNFGEGILTDIKLATPMLGSHAVGDYFSKREETMQNICGTQDGKEDGMLKKTVKGFLKSLLYALPIIGTYQLGKNKIGHENVKNLIEAEKNGTTYELKDNGGFKAYFTGLGEKIKNIIPFYGTYYRGKMMNESENMYKDSQIIAAQNEVLNNVVA